jgi:hypothetical protein
LGAKIRKKGLPSFIEKSNPFTVKKLQFVELFYITVFLIRMMCTFALPKKRDEIYAK